MTSLFRYPELETQENILAATVGTQQAKTVMRLPAELRASLYGEILAFGPGFAQINEFQSAAKKQDNLISPLYNLGWSQTMNEDLGGISGFGEEPEYGYLWWNAEQLSAGMAVSSHINRGITIVMFMLAGQHLFAPNFLVRMLPCCKAVDEILDTAGMKPLQIQSFPYEFESESFFLKPGGMTIPCSTTREDKGLNLQVW